MGRRLKKIMISMILSIAILFSEADIPVMAEENMNTQDTEESIETIRVESTESIPKEEMKGILEDGTETVPEEGTEVISEEDSEIILNVNEENENSNVLEYNFEELLSDGLEVMSLYGDGSTADQEPMALADDSLSLSVTYPSDIKCGVPVTFTMNATGGTGNYKYRIAALMDSELVSVYDISYGSNGSYGDSNQFTFTFYASGTYYIRFSVMDMTTYQTKTTGLYEYPIVIQDAGHPSVEQIVADIAAQCEAVCSTDFEKALWLHDWIIDNADYDNSYSYCSAEGVLARGAGTCESYHRAYVKLLNKVGIETGRVEGNGHVWTAVKMDGEWYQIDSTWDDMGASYKGTYYEHMYFGLTDYIIGLVHDDHKAAVPGYESTALENNYFIKTGQITQWSDPFVDTIKQNLADGKMEFTLPVTSSMPNSYKNVIYNLVAYQLSKEKWDNKELAVSYADVQLTCKVVKVGADGTGDNGNSNAGNGNQDKDDGNSNAGSGNQNKDDGNSNTGNGSQNKGSYTRTIADGVYNIESALGAGYLVDVNGGGSNNCANIQLWKGSQSFRVTYLGDGKYSLMATCSGKYVDAENNGRTAGTNILQYDWKGGENQKWYIQDAGNGYYYIKSAVSELCMDVEGAVAKNLANIRLWTADGGNGQKFRFIQNAEGLKSDSSTPGKTETTYIQTIANGTYRIESALKSGYLLDVNGAVRDNCANIQLWKGTQTFKVTYLGSGKYSLMATCSGKYVDAENGGRTAGTNILQYNWNGGENQKWYIQDAGNGYYYIRSAVSELYMDVWNAAAKNGSNIQLWSGNGGANQKFKFVNEIGSNSAERTIANGTYEIESALGNGLLLDIYGGTNKNCANVQIWRGSQQFKVAYLGDGKYSLMATCSGKYIDAENGGTVNGTNVLQYEWNGGENQKWYIEDAGNGYFYIVSAQSGLRLDVCNGEAKSGANVLLWNANNGRNQKFRFNKV